ncbi:hypothetical protein PMI35_01771 [Pseudomonas sp. GM78]|uniref:hypothetical protein n=1 Tax=Pseudomonas sp. GM78 TaxID=1144337 RepID=UPI00027089EE|nr:hypothetical protein [Pseudomonas sp. GM78]EJN30948.1 hypothetical protein PMI35_01771 [Pseudomonas sp. GM78]
MYSVNKSQVGYQAAFASKLAPTGIRVHLQNQVGSQAAFAGKPRSYGLDTKSLQNTEPVTCQPTEQVYIKAPLRRNAREELFIYSFNG